jgi:hypothetical protein
MVDAFATVLSWAVTVSSQSPQKSNRIVVLVRTENYQIWVTESPDGDADVPTDPDRSIDLSRFGWTDIASFTTRPAAEKFFKEAIGAYVILRSTTVEIGDHEATEEHVTAVTLPALYAMTDTAFAALRLRCRTLSVLAPKPTWLYTHDLPRPESRTYRLFVQENRWKVITIVPLGNRGLGPHVRVFDAAGGKRIVTKDPAAFDATIADSAARWKRSGWTEIDTKGIW